MLLAQREFCSQRKLALNASLSKWMQVQFREPTAPLQRRLVQWKTCELISPTVDIRLTQLKISTPKTPGSPTGTRSHQSHIVLLLFCLKGRTSKTSGHNQYVHAASRECRKIRGLQSFKNSYLLGRCAISMWLNYRGNIMTNLRQKNVSLRWP